MAFWNRGECILFFFFFSSRRRHTRSDRDWSSDVCSSDLATRSTSTTQLGSLSEARRYGGGAAAALAGTVRCAGFCSRLQRPGQCLVGREGASSSFADYKLRLSKVIDIRGAHAVAARVAKCRPGGLSFSPPAPRQVGRWCGAVQTTTPTASAAPQ